MTPTKKRPVHLYLPSIQFPVAALVSIGHRISGVLMVLAIPFAIYLLQLSLQGAEGFVSARQLLDHGLVKLLLLLLGWGLLHHLFAGLRFFAIDFDLGVDRVTARRTAWIASIAALLSVVGLGILL